jgi:hypothetical protein
MVKFEELEKEIGDKLSKIGNVTIKKGNWDESKEEFKESSGGFDCYLVGVTKDLRKGGIIKSISDFSKVDELKVKFKGELVDILKYFKNKGCEIYMTHSSTHNQITYDIYMIKTKDLEEWYVPLKSSNWYDNNSSSGWRAKRYWLSSNEIIELEEYCDGKGWLMERGIDISNERISKSGRGIPAWYDRIYGDRANIGFYFISTGVTKYSKDRDWNIAFVKISDDYFLLFFRPGFTSNSYSLPDCLVHPGRDGVYYKCDQLEALKKCLDEHQF